MLFILISLMLFSTAFFTSLCWSYELVSHSKRQVFLSKSFSPLFALSLLYICAVEATAMHVAVYWLLITLLPRLLCFDLLYKD